MMLVRAIALVAENEQHRQKHYLHSSLLWLRVPYLSGRQGIGS
jgi:hypothetical protein